MVCLFVCLFSSSSGRVPPGHTFPRSLCLTSCCSERSSASRSPGSPPGRPNWAHASTVSPQRPGASPGKHLDEKSQSVRLSARPAWGLRQHPHLALSSASRGTQLGAARQDRWRPTLGLPPGRVFSSEGPRVTQRCTCELAEGEEAAPGPRASSGRGRGGVPPPRPPASPDPAGRSGTGARGAGRPQGIFPGQPPLSRTGPRGESWVLGPRGRAESSARV